jgi:UDP-N-acetylglucosamine--N-acetylmuramyl-(pentapeptide) pyrophosphoryl-undecaprenol N-acetylglucosamine transferase
MMLVAGGTGGHILPAIAFGDWLRREKPHVEINYMSGSRPIEREIYRASNAEPRAIGITGSPAGVRGVRSLRRWADLMKGAVEAGRILKDFSPDACVLFGGYASVPALAAGRVMGIYTVLHEQNALAGRVTKLASKLGVKIASGWENCEGLKRSRYTPVGVPIRRMPAMPKETAWDALKVRPHRGSGPVVSVMTGSLGSGGMANILTELAGRAPFLSWLFLLLDPESETPRSAGNVVRLPNMWDISPLYSVSDMLITRGGASTLTEAIAARKPTVIVPWRGAADDHQMKNALAALAVSGETALVWDERGDSLGELAVKLELLHDKYIRENGFTANLLYNSGEAAETNCRRLWCFAANYGKGEVDVE